MQNIFLFVGDFHRKILLKPITGHFLLLDCNNLQSTGLMWVKHDMISIHCIFG